MSVLVKAMAVTPERTGIAFDRDGRGFAVGFFQGHWWDMNVILLGYAVMGLIEPLFPDDYTIVEQVV